METAKTLSRTVRLSNDDIGSLHRRVYEIVRRIEEGTVPYGEAMAGLQRVIERTQESAIEYTPHARPREFPILRHSERRRSMARLPVRLHYSVVRLRHAQRNPERIIAELWEMECIPEACVNSGRTPINTILGGDTKLAERDVQVINSTIQYLGTNGGMEFLRKFLGASLMWLN